MKETYGVPVEEIQEGIKHGVRKINIDTDIRLAMTGGDPQVHEREQERVRPARLPEARARSGQGRSASSATSSSAAPAWASKIKAIPLEVMAAKYKAGELAQIVK